MQNMQHKQRHVSFDIGSFIHFQNTLQDLFLTMQVNVSILEVADGPSVIWTGLRVAFLLPS